VRRLTPAAAAELDGEAWNTWTHMGVHLLVKRRDLEQRLSQCGWRFLRSGGRHDVWTDGDREEAVPRHREINENLARSILRRASGRKQ
jgi:mRNA interferase HicA